MLLIVLMVPSVCDAVPHPKAQLEPLATLFRQIGTGLSRFDVRDGSFATKPAGPPAVRCPLRRPKRPDGL